jgi:lysyl-tRNA synthetase class I
MLTPEHLRHFLWMWELDDRPVFQTRAAPAQLAESFNFLINKLSELETLELAPNDEAVQYWFYEAAKLHFAANIRDFFEVIYLATLGKKEGVRLGAFANMIGLNDFAQMLGAGIVNPLQNWLPLKLLLKDK